MRPLTFRESMVYGSGTFGADMFYNFLNLVGPLYLDRYPQVPVWAAGLLAQERSFAGAFVQPVVGAISDRTRTRIGRRRPFFILGISLTAASLLYLSGFPPLVPMLIVLAINAFFLNVAVDPYLALMADIVPSEQRAWIGTLLAILRVAGQLAATLLAAMLWDRSPQLVMILVAAGLVITWAITTIGVREPAQPPAPREPVRIDVARYVQDLLSRRELLKYIVAAALFWLGTGGVLPYLTRFGTRVLGTSEGEAIGLFLPALGGSVAGAVGAAYLAGRAGRKNVLAAGLFVFAALALLGSQVQTVPQALLALGAIGIANGVFGALYLPLLVDLVPPERAAELTGLGSGVWSAVQPIGALLAGILIQVSDSYRTSFVGAAMCVFLAALLLLTVRPPQPSTAAT